MFSTRSLSAGWIRSEAKRLKTDPIILEKCLFALTLVGRLAEEGLDFVFKGGTSLMLHLEPVRRLSIDVDIASMESLDRVQEILDRIANGAPFVRWDHQDWRDGENPPTKYFRLAYLSPIHPEQEGSVQLDVLVTQARYPEIEEKEVKASFAEVERPVRVSVPSVDSLLGDKLTAFAPTTIGILYDPISKKTGQPVEPRPIRVMKQLFDVGELFAHATNLEMVSQSYAAHFEQQNIYRGGKFTIGEALEDTLAAAYTLSQIGVKYAENNDRTAFFKNGVTALNTHLIGDRLQLVQAKAAASRAALLASLIKSQQTGHSLADFRTMPTDIALLKELRIDGRWQKLHTLRKTNLEAFYYWHLAHRFDGTAG